MSKIHGNFEEALIFLIERLRRGKGHIKLADELLRDWDERRGNDWFTSTRRSEEQQEDKIE